MNCDLHGLVLRSSYNLPVHYSYCNSFIVCDVHGEFGLINVRLFNVSLAISSRKVGEKHGLFLSREVTLSTGSLDYVGHYEKLHWIGWLSGQLQRWKTCRWTAAKHASCICSASRRWGPCTTRVISSMPTSVNSTFCEKPAHMLCIHRSPKLEILTSLLTFR